MSSNKGGKTDCKLHPGSKYGEQMSKNASTSETDSRCKDLQTNKPVPCSDCDGWKRYSLYAIPLLLYIPWAISKFRCCPKCCPPPSCCPKVKCQAAQNTCCGPDGTKLEGSYQPKKQEDFRCGKDKKACQD